MKEVNGVNLDKALRLSITAGALLAGFSFFFYFVIFLPQKERTRTAENAEAASKQAICLKAAEQAGNQVWDEKCVEMEREPRCELPLVLADSLDDGLKYLREDCFRKYPQR